jgi:hypothetical protein
MWIDFCPLVYPIDLIGFETVQILLKLIFYTDLGTLRGGDRFY